MRKPRLYFSFRSPYSWFTVTRLLAAVPDAFDAIDWLPYWDPDEHTTAALTERGAEFHYVQMSRAKHRYILMDTKRLAQRDGLTMAWPIDVEPFWELPHLAWLYARREGRAAEFYRAVTAARWQRGEDICTPAVLAACAREAGVDPEKAVAAHEDPAIRAEAADSLARAYRDDVFGVPYVLYGPHRFWGLDRLEVFLSTWRGISLPAPVSDVTPGAGYDTDTTGGCG